MHLGKMRTEKVKRIARELTELHPDEFTADFEHNKKILETLLEVSSKRLRNSIAGYIVQLLKGTETPEATETE